MSPSILLTLLFISLCVSSTFGRRQFIPPLYNEKKHSTPLARELMLVFFHHYMISLNIIPTDRSYFSEEGYLRPSVVEGGYPRVTCLSRKLNQEPFLDECEMSSRVRSFAIFAILKHAKSNRSSCACSWGKSIHSDAWSCRMLLSVGQWGRKITTRMYAGTRCEYCRSTVVHQSILHRSHYSLNARRLHARFLPIMITPMEWTSAVASAMNAMLSTPIRCPLTTNPPPQIHCPLFAPPLPSFHLEHDLHFFFRITLLSLQSLPDFIIPILVGSMSWWSSGPLAIPSSFSDSITLRFVFKNELDWLLICPLSVDISKNFLFLDCLINIYS